MKIFTIVFSLHLIAICFLFVLPGCATTDKKKEPSASDTAAPMASEEVEVTGPAAGKELHPDFNAGLRGSDEASSRPSGRYPPTRPSWDFEAVTPEPSEEVLQPVPKTPEPTLPSSEEREVSTVMYTVKSGDTLSGIARRYGTTVAALKSANALENDLIRVRDTLVIPGGKGAGRKVSAPAKVSPKREVSGSGEAVHIVVSGDTPSGIARQYGMSAKDLMQRNHISDPTKLQIGQRLFVNAEKASVAAPRSASASRTTPNEPSPISTPDFEERERSILDEEEDIPVIPLDSDESGDGRSAN